MGGVQSYGVVITSCDAQNRKVQCAKVPLAKGDNGTQEKITLFSCLCIGPLFVRSCIPYLLGMDKFS